MGSEKYPHLMLWPEKKCDKSVDLGEFGEVPLSFGKAFELRFSAPSGARFPPKLPNPMALWKIC